MSFPAQRRLVSASLSLSVAALALTQGCYRYAPLTTEELSPGSVVRLRLTAPGAERLASVVGPGTTTVDGRVIAVSDTAYLVAVSGVVRHGPSGATDGDEGTPVGWSGEQISLPRSALSGAQRRVLDRKRSFVVAGIGVAAIALTGKAVRSAGGGATTGPGGGAPAP